MMDDHQLISRYVQDGDHAAFAELARRYAGLVYSAARRRLRDADLAHDVTQVVFLVLARKAASIQPDTVLSAWLLRATGYTAKNMIKGERRRQHRERQVAGQKAQLTVAFTEPEDDGAGGDWARVAPLLDQALDSLGESVRSAVALRWFEGRSFRDVGQRLGVSEAAAKQKVFRALGRMRRYMALRGVSVPTATLTALVAANAVQAAPPATVEAAIAAGASGTAAAAGLESLVQPVAALMRWTAGRALLPWAGAALAISLTAVAFKVALADNRVSVLADLHAVPPAARPAGATRPAGIVVAHNGWPLMGASVLISTASKPAVYRGKPDPAAVLTGADGRFALPPVNEPYLLLVWHDTAGFAQVSEEELADSGGGRIELLPWARVEGITTAGGAPAANATIVLGHWFRAGGRAKAVICELETRADVKGRFSIARVPPGDGWVARRLSTGAGSPGLAHRTYLTAQPGAALSIRHGGAAGSRAVVGRFLPDAAARAGERSPPIWRATLVRAPAGEGRPAYHGAMFETALTVTTDGSFRADDVPPGAYQLRGKATVVLPDKSVLVSSVELDVQVSGLAGGTATPQDLGTIGAKFAPAAGASAPGSLARDAKDIP